MLAGPFNSGEIGTLCVVTSSDQDSNHPVTGLVVGVYVSPNLSSVSAPTITVSMAGDTPLTILNVVTDKAGWYFPTYQMHAPANGAPISSVYAMGIPVDGVINVEISDGEEGDSVDVWLMLDD